MLRHRQATSRFLPAALALSLASGAVLTAGSAASATTPFEDIKGSWEGGGSLTLQEGKSENLTCRAYYTSSGAGRELGVAVRCAGQSAKFELRSRLSHDDGKVSGTWEERTYNGSGNVSGTLKPGRMRLRFQGSVSGSMSVDFTASSQSIIITVDTGGASVTSVRLNMSRQ